MKGFYVVSQLVAGLLVVAGASLAQNPKVDNGSGNATIVPYLPSNFAAIGFAWNSGTSPQRAPVSAAGWATYAKLISSSAGLYSYSSWDETSADVHKFIPRTSARTGFAMVLKQIGPLSIIGFGNAGFASSGTVSGGSTFGGAFSGGGFGAFRIGKTYWEILVGARVLRSANVATQTIYEVGFGRAY